MKNKPTYAIKLEKMLEREKKERIKQLLDPAFMDFEPLPESSIAAEPQEEEKDGNQSQESQSE